MKLLQVLPQRLKPTPVIWLWLASMIAGMSGLVYSILANKQLDLTEMATLGFFSNLILFFSIISVTLAIVENRFQTSETTSNSPIQPILGWWSLGIGIIIACLISLTFSWWERTFHLNINQSMLMVVALQLFAMMPLAWLRGLLQAKLRFYLVAVSLLFESSFKIAIGWVASYKDYSVHAFVFGMTISTILTLMALFLLARRSLKISFLPVQLKVSQTVQAFFGQTVLQRAGFLGLVSVDVLMVNHYFNKEWAGIYVLLSLMGKMVFFLTQSFYNLLTPLITSVIDSKHTREQIFWLLTSVSLLLTLFLIFILITFPEQTLGVLIGNRYLLIIDYVLPYSLAALLFSLGMMAALYRLLTMHFQATLAVYTGLFMQILLIGIFHETMEEVVYSVLVAAIIMSTLAFGPMLLRRSKLAYNLVRDLL